MEETSFQRDLPSKYYELLGKILVNCSYIDVMFDSFFALCDYDKTLGKIISKDSKATLGKRKNELFAVIKEMEHTNIGELLFSKLKFDWLTRFITRRNELMG